MLVSVSPIVGIAIGSVIPTSIVYNDSDIPTLMLVLAIISSAIGIISTIFIRDKPKSPPSPLFSTDLDPFFVGLRKVIKVYPYIILLFSFGTGVGIFNAVATILLQIIAPSGYSGKSLLTAFRSRQVTGNDAGTFTAVMIGFGLVGAVITGPIVDKTHKYKEIYQGAYVKIRHRRFYLKICFGFTFALVLVAFDSS